MAEGPSGQLIVEVAAQPAGTDDTHHHRFPHRHFPPIRGESTKALLHAGNRRRHEGGNRRRTCRQQQARRAGTVVAQFVVDHFGLQPPEHTEVVDPESDRPRPGSRQQYQDDNERPHRRRHRSSQQQKTLGGEFDHENEALMRPGADAEHRAQRTTGNERDSERAGSGEGDRQDGHRRGIDTRHQEVQQ